MIVWWWWRLDGGSNRNGGNNVNGGGNSNMKGDGHAKCGCDNISVSNKLKRMKMENVGMVENVLISQK